MLLPTPLTPSPLCFFIPGCLQSICSVPGTVLGTSKQIHTRQMWSYFHGVYNEPNSWFMRWNSSDEIRKIHDMKLKNVFGTWLMGKAGLPWGKGSSDLLAIAPGWSSGIFPSTWTERWPECCWVWVTWSEVQGCGASSVTMALLLTCLLQHEIISSCLTGFPQIICKGYPDQATGLVLPAWGFLWWALFLGFVCLESI